MPILLSSVTLTFITDRDGVKSLLNLIFDIEFSPQTVALTSSICIEHSLSEGSSVLLVSSDIPSILTSMPGSVTELTSPSGLDTLFKLRYLLGGILPYVKTSVPSSKLA